MLDDDREFRVAARAAGTTIWDVREPPEVPLFSGDVYAVAAPIVLTVGNDCAVGKMSVALEVVRAANAAGTNARFVPTGQTGILIAGWGISVDRVISDFAPGAAEQLVLYAAHEGADLIVVEGQGAINHPAYAPVTLALMTGCAPDALILVFDPRRTSIESYETPTLGTPKRSSFTNGCSRRSSPPRSSASRSTRAVSDEAASARRDRARRDETGLPADDVVRFGARALLRRDRARTSPSGRRCAAPSG